MAHSFHLQQQVDNYIAALNAKNSLTSDDENELHAHLFDTIEALTAKGISEEEALLIAKHRLGNQQEIATEFEKVNGANIFNKEWAFIFVGIAAAVAIKNISDGVLFILSYRVAMGTLPVLTASVLLSAFYIGVAVLAVSIFKKGEALTKFFRERVFDRNKSVLALVLVLFGFLCFVPITAVLPFESAAAQKAMHTFTLISNNNLWLQFITRGTFPVVIIMSLFFSLQSVRKKAGWHTLFKSSNYWYIFLLGIGLETAAAIFGRMFQLGAVTQPFVFAGIIAAGVAAFMWHNRHDKKWLLKTCCFVAFSFTVETLASIARTADGNWAHSPLFFYFVAETAGIISGMIIGVLMMRKKYRPGFIPGF